MHFQHYRLRVTVLKNQSSDLGQEITICVHLCVSSLYQIQIFHLIFTYVYYKSPSYSTTNRFFGFHFLGWKIEEILHRVVISKDTRLKT